MAALGADGMLVGRSHECDFPASVASLPVLTRPAFDLSGGSAAIDRAVKERAGRALSIYDIDEDQLADLAPNIIITQDQCAVCAVPFADVAAAVNGWAPGGTTLVSLSPSRLDDIWDDIRTVGDAVGAGAAVAPTLARLQGRLRVVEDVSGNIPLSDRPTVAAIEWLDPPMAAGNWVPELIGIAGGRPLFAEAGRHSPWLEWDALLRADPDVVVLMPCGYTIEQTLAELSTVTGRTGWSDLRAVREGRVFVVDGNAYFNRSGPRLVDSAELLTELFWPGHVDSRYYGAGWRRVGTGGTVGGPGADA